MGWYSKYKNRIMSILIGTIVMGAIALFITGTYLYRLRVATEQELNMRELNEVEGLMTADIEEQQGNEKQDQPIDQLPMEDSANTRLDVPVVGWEGKAYKRNSYMKAILVAGIDRSNEMTEVKGPGEAGQSDGLFLIAQDTARNTSKILIIPRDTITQIIYTDDLGKVLGKKLDHLSLAFAYGDGMHTSGEYMVEAVSDLLHGLKIDGYLAFNMAMMGALNDAVGGVTVTIPSFGMENSKYKFAAGQKITLEGDMAKEFVRYRDINIENSAIYRMDQQKEYITQYFQALKETSKENSQIVNQLFEMLESHMVTNLRKEEYLKIALDTVVSSSIDSDNFYMIPGKGVTTEEYDEFYVDDKEMISLVLQLFYREIP